MSKNRKFTYLLTEFCEKHGLDPVRIEANNNYEFYIDGTEVQCYPQGEDLIIYSRLCALPEDPQTRQGVLKNLLQLSLLNSDTEDFVLSVDEQDLVNLSHRRSLNYCSLLDLESAIENLLRYVEHYGQQLIEQNTSHDDMMFDMMSVV